MISFYPGPSKVYPQIPQYVQDAHAQGVLSINHRSEAFVAICRKAVTLLKDRLRVPEDYQVFFASSATECWEIISQSLVEQASFHLYNGAFGEKWYTYATKLQPMAKAAVFGLQESPDVSALRIPDEASLIALTHNETSNATALHPDVMRQIRQQHPDRLIAVDATSSMAGVHLDMSQADVWYASVQKCFGLPAGMAVLICSPAAVHKALQIGEGRHYNSLTAMIAQMQHWQTNYTPNVLGIYLLMRVLEQVPAIEVTDALIRKRCQQWMRAIEAMPDARLLVQHAEVQSQTVVALEAAPDHIQWLRNQAREAGIVLGNGYGQWKPTTLRIANFPAINAGEIARLQQFFASLR